MSEPKRVAVLGATGSIGSSAALELAFHRDKFRTVAVAANKSIAKLAETAKLLGADTAITGDVSLEDELRKELSGSGIAAKSGEAALIETVEREDVDIVLCAIIGVAGIRPVISALRCGKTVALASKEVLCLAGELVMREAAKSPGGRIVPVDSEHSGVFQCLAGRDPKEISKLWLTASGGPFRTWKKEDIARATCSDALKHPTWSMGRKITIDSATMMNKALEVIEASYLFGVPQEKIGAVINPTSIVHAFIELTDGTVISQMSTPDMRLAIRYALSYPERLGGEVPRLDLGKTGKIEFEDIDDEKFPSIKLARTALAMGGTAPCVLNAANDVAVERFINGEITVPDIWKIITIVLESHTVEHPDTLERILEIDAEARLAARAVTL
ncbi:MAG: 1-deoxy-D-xylulose-5-phosphate reductoisomerase [Lentisphaeria bacterium]|nr:1-deoxy-D-xylulose-5-phosphate reductoisomerase [Lentisphaeria bacterium]